MANKLEELGRFWWLKVKQHLWWERSKGRLWWTERFPVFRGGAAPDDTRKAWHGRALWANGSKVTNSSLARLKLLCSQVYLIKTFCWQGIQWSINSSSKIPLTFFLIFQKSVGWVQVEGKLQSQIQLRVLSPSIFFSRPDNQVSELEAIGEQVHNASFLIHAPCQITSVLSSRNYSVRILFRWTE